MLFLRKRNGRSCRESSHCPREAVRQPSGHCLGEHVGQSAVVPPGALSATVEPVPERLAQETIIKENSFGIVGFVGERDEVACVFAWQSRTEMFLAQRLLDGARPLTKPLAAE